MALAAHETLLLAHERDLMKLDRTLSLLALTSCLVTTACGDDESSSEPKAGACTQTLQPGTDDVTTLIEALADSQPGQTVCFSPGTYRFDKLINFSGISDVTLRGAGKSRDDVVLDFSAQSTGREAINVEADGFTVENLTVKDPPGDGIKITLSKRPTFRNVHAYYTTTDLGGRGAYALYPAECEDVLIEDCEVSGSSDAAIYLGQSKRGIVRRNKAYDAVIGIEAENSTDIEIYDNEAWNNTTGILIVNLPDLPMKGVFANHVHDNVVRENNRENVGHGFAEGIPRGTGMVVMASDTTEVARNQFKNNSGPGLLLVSWPTFEALGQPKANDPLFDQYTEKAYVHDNSFTNNGMNPVGFWADLFPEARRPVPDIIWDGYLTPDASKDPPSTKPCIQGNGTVRFLNLNIPNGGLSDDTKLETSLAAYDCSYPTQPTVKLQSQ